MSAVLKSVGKPPRMVGKFEIRSDVPVPQRGARTGSARRYPVDRMLPGESLTVDTIVSFQRLRRCAQDYTRRYQPSWVYRSLWDFDSGTGTVWRVL